MIGLIMAVYRYYKMDENKENFCNLRENYTSIIGKFSKLINTSDNYVIKNDNLEDWKQIVNTYNEEILVNYLSIREIFDNIFTYKDIIYYKNKFKKLFLQNE